MITRVRVLSECSGISNDGSMDGWGTKCFYYLRTRAARVEKTLESKNPPQGGPPDLEWKRLAAVTRPAGKSTPGYISALDDKPSTWQKFCNRITRKKNTFNNNNGDIAWILKADLTVRPHARLSFVRSVPRSFSTRNFGSDFRTAATYSSSSYSQFTYVIGYVKTIYFQKPIGQTSALFLSASMRPNGIILRRNDWDRQNNGFVHLRVIVTRSRNRRTVYNHRCGNVRCINR